MSMNNNVCEMKRCQRRLYRAVFTRALLMSYCPRDKQVVGEERYGLMQDILMDALTKTTFPALIRDLHLCMSMIRDKELEVESGSVLYGYWENKNDDDHRFWLEVFDKGCGQDSFVELETFCKNRISIRVSTLQFISMIDRLYQFLIDMFNKVATYGQIRRCDNVLMTNFSPCQRKMLREQYKELKAIAPLYEEVLGVLRGIVEREDAVYVYGALVKDEAAEDQEVQEAEDDLIVTLSEDTTRLFQVLRDHDSLQRKVAKGLEIHSSLKKAQESRRAEYKVRRFRECQAQARWHEEEIERREEMIYQQGRQDAYQELHRCNVTESRQIPADDHFNRSGDRHHKRHHSNQNGRPEDQRAAKKQRRDTSNRRYVHGGFHF